MKTLTKKLKQKWIEALKSGDYIQGKGFLYMNNTYCCLGVLRKIARIQTTSDYLLSDYKEDSCIRGLSTDEQNKLADMNDNQSKNFNDIAKYIEENINL